MAISSAALAYKRSALMTATKVTVKAPSEEVLEARDNLNYVQEKIANVYWESEDQILRSSHPVDLQKVLSLVCLQLG
jgi:hypothetical protein